MRARGVAKGCWSPAVVRRVWRHAATKLTTRPVLPASAAVTIFADSGQYKLQYGAGLYARYVSVGVSCNFYAPDFPSAQSFGGVFRPWREYSRQVPWRRMAFRNGDICADYARAGRSSRALPEGVFYSSGGVYVASCPEVSLQRRLH